MTVEAKAGDSLQVLVSDEGKIELSYDKNDPHWGWLAKCSDDELQAVSYTHLTLPTN